MVGRVIRRIAASVLRAVLLRPRTSLAIVVVLAIALGSLVILPGLASTPGSPGVSTRSVAAAPSRGEVRRSGVTDAAPVPAVENYLKGMTTYDAKLMFDSLNDDMRRQMQAQGGLERLQESLNQAKLRGVTYDEIAFIGAYSLRDGGKYLFYVISRRGFNSPDQVEQVWFVFTVDPSGKIAKID